MTEFRARVSKSRPSFTVEADLEFTSGQVTALVGPSGSGKTTVLRLLAGLEEADAGFIDCDGTSWLDSEAKLFLPVQQRKVGFVFQDYALFGHLNVAENIAYGIARSRRASVLNTWLPRLELESLASSYPSQLSGGQRQRVALGRALAIEPRLLLLDEPFSALDTSLRRSMRKELKQFIAKVECPVVMVSHDLDEVRELADRIYVFTDGKVVRSGSADDVLSCPQNRVAAETLGWQNFLPVLGSEGGNVYGSWGTYALDYQAPENTACLAFQAHHVRFNNQESYSSIGVVVKDVCDRGAYREVRLLCNGGEEIIAHRGWNEPIPAPGSCVSIHISPWYVQPLSAQPDDGANGEMEFNCSQLQRRG